MATPHAESSGNGSISPTRAGDGDSAGLGALLRRARERRGLTLEQISNETKLPRRHLEALEHDDLAAVPGEFYRRAEIRAYARAVNLDPNLAVAQLEGALRPTVAREARPRTPRTHEPTRSLRRALIVIGVVAAAALFGREMVERQPALDGDTRLRSTGGSPLPSVPPVRELPPHTVSPSQGAQSDQVALSSTPSGDAPAAATEATDGRASAASNGDLAVTTEQADARASSDSATEIVVITQPPGARVTVDGIGWGIAPLMIRYLPVGDKRIRVSKEGYATEERVVHLGEGHSRRLDIRMRAAP